MRVNESTYKHVAPFTYTPYPLLIPKDAKVEDMKVKVVRASYI
jgi:hypothetical protein